MTTPEAWLEAAGALPLRFAQVREDGRLELDVLRALGERPARVAMVASGGETVALLAASGRVASLNVADPNPAQIALARLKVSLLTRPPGERLALLGHARLDEAERASALRRQLAELGMELEALGPPGTLAAAGPDHAGRYEHTFGRLRAILAPRASEVDVLLAEEDPATRERHVRAGTPLGDAFDAAFADAFSLPNLVRLFGPDATRRPVEPFPRHFAARTRWVLARPLGTHNPWLHQLLAGRFPPHARYDWLDAMHAGPPPRIEWDLGGVETLLARSPAESLDLVQLSNVLDWLAPAEAERTLRLARRALRPGGALLVRQLNSTLDIPRLDAGLAWDDEAGRTLHARDRSFFYSRVHLGRRP